MTFKNTILTILNARLKTLDTILPLLMELDTKRVEILFLSPDILTTKEIEQNIVINDCLKSIGKVIHIYDQEKQNFFFNKIIFLKFAIYFLIKLIINKIDFIYFSELKGKKKFLKFLKYNVFLCENDPYGHTKSIEWTKKLEREELQGHKIKSGSFKIPKQNLILFTKNYYNLDLNKQNKNVNFLAYPNIKLSERWINYILSNKEFYLKKEFEKNGLEYSDKIITISLGIFTKDFGWDKTERIMENLLNDCLEELIDLKLDIPIFLKPYPLATPIKNKENIDTLYKILSSQNYKKFVVTYLHPMILAQSSMLMIANSNTATFADFRYFDVPTIEYTHYSDLLLKKTNNQSIRPDWVSYFINHDRIKLKNCLKNLTSEKFTKNNNIPKKINYNKVNDQLINRLNGNKKLIIQKYESIEQYLN